MEMSIDSKDMGSASERRMVIVDAGSTKTVAVILNRDRGEVENTLFLNPVNPMIVSDSEIVSSLTPLFETLENKVDVVFFGAGCLPGNPSDRIGKAFRKCKAVSDVVVQSDIVAAALSLFGDKNGIACILGTGSNTALYKYGQIETSVPSLGYVLGDEGSGCALGKRLIRSLFRNELSEDIRNLFYKETYMSLPEILERVYRGEMPNRFLAQFTRFIAANIENHEIRQIVRSEFSSLFVNQISRYPDYRFVPIGFIGSVAKVFEEQLRHVAAEFQCNVADVCASPVEGLVNYFKKY